MSEVALHVKVTVEDRLLVNFANWNRLHGLLNKWLLSFQLDSGNCIFCSISYE